MKSYLGLVSEYAKAHKKKNRLTVICIVVSVMLITAVFGMADMSIKAQVSEFIRQNGNFHAIITNITDDTAKQIDGCSDVEVSGWVGMTDDTNYRKKELVVQSSSYEMAAQMNLEVTAGRYPIEADEALLDAQGLEQFGLTIGGPIEIMLSDGKMRRYIITGTYGDFSSLKGSDAHGLLITTEGMRQLPPDLYKEYYYLQFKDGANIRRALSEIKSEYGLSDGQVSANVRLLALLGQSDDSSILEIYLTAAILFVLVALAGTFMIASSFNMSILERTQFFGLLRCLGATKKQIRRYIRLEGLLYCLKGIPIGLLTGCMALWGSVFFLNTLNLQDFPPMTMFQISWPGISAGALLGFLVVMLASGSPAKYASKVSPQAAVTGNLSYTNNQVAAKSSNTKIFHVDTAMGIRHAVSNKKSMALIAGSFAISIVLFLCFTVLITFMNHALKPLRPYAPDLSVKAVDDRSAVSRSVMDELSNLPHIRKIYGRMFFYDIPANDGHRDGSAMLISYDEPQFQWAEKTLISGNMEEVKNGEGILVDYGISCELNWKTGDFITLYFDGEPKKMKISGIISDIPFEAENGGWVIICSEPSFTALTGISDYTIIDMQVEPGTDIADQVRKRISPDLLLLDKQQINSETRTGYHAMAVFVYGFLLVIALVALINIINTVNSSVSARIGNYGVMRAVGMSGKQLKKVVIAEAAVYASAGSVTGGILGLILHRFLFEKIITLNWGDPWEPPFMVLGITIAAALLTTFLAVLSPIKRIREKSIISTVNAEQ